MPNHEIDDDKCTMGKGVVNVTKADYSSFLPLASVKLVKPTALAVFSTHFPKPLTGTWRLKRNQLFKRHENIEIKLKWQSFPQCAPLSRFPSLLLYSSDWRPHD